MTDMSVFRDLGAKLVPDSQNDPAGRSDPIFRRKGIINAVNLSARTATVDINGILIPDCEYFTHYAPVVGDIVWVDISDRKPIIMGYAGTTSTYAYHYIGDAGQPGFENGWAAHPDYSSGDLRPHFTRTGEIVTVTAILQKVSGALDTAAFTLPVGYRPRGVEPYASYNLTQGSVRNDGRVVVVVASGTVTNFYCINAAFRAYY